jgi:hypothetical protein
MTVRFYPKAIMLTAVVLMLGFALGAWSAAAIWRLAAIAAVGIIIAQRIRAMRRRSRAA